MRTPVAAAAVVLVAACGGGSRMPVQLAAPAPASVPQTVDCVSRQLQSMDYNVVSNDPQSGTIVARHINEQPFWLRMIGYRNTADQLTITMEANQLRVAAVSSDPEAPGTGGVAEAGGAASSAAQRDAQRLLNACSAR